MKVPILLSGLPCDLKDSPSVFLIPGFWTFTELGLIDSEVEVRAESRDCKLNEEVELLSPTIVKVNFIKKGTEKNITIIAHKKK